MPRQANATDFWRGFALLTIFVNHAPGIYFERFTHRNIGLSDSAELFVFLAGWGLRYVVSRPDMAESSALLVWHLGRRAIRIYTAQILIISIAIAMLAAASIVLDNPLVVSWHNAEAVFYDPVRANIGLVLLTHQLGYFNILPLYVALMAIAPVIALIDRRAPGALLPISLAVYAMALVFEINLPTWPVEGEWFFNPLTWQLIFVLGFVLPKESPAANAVRRQIGPLRVLSVPILIAGAATLWLGWLPDPTNVPEPRLLFIDYKTFATPIRVIHFLALAAVFSAAFPYVARLVPGLSNFFSLLGRNSLNVFCVGSILSLAAQILRFAAGGTIFIDTLIVVAGAGLMYLTAWLSEWPQRMRRPS